ncbi:MAG: glycosyltransferase [Deltaproteobacteria bacterium]|nr:glycosyltransferase [Deltaproteobacteria bacterium]
MILVLLVLAALIFVGGRPLRAEVGELAGPWPQVAVLVPVTGAAAGLEERLRRLLSQDYPDYQVVFTTRDAADPATAVIRSLLPKFSGSRQVLAGPARGCGQKNQNLLAAVNLVGRTPEVLVFCDSNQEAQATWLKELVAPIAAGKAQVSSGFHHLIAIEPRIIALGRAVTVLALYLTKGFRRLNQPWGGATAIHRSLFENLEVARLWRENIVDDVSLAAQLVQAGVQVGIPRGASLHTMVNDESLAGWQDWLVRQWLYLKFCMPATWLAGGLLVNLVAALVVLAGMRLVLLPLGASAVGPALAGALFLGGLAGLGLALRAYHPDPGPRMRWLPAYFAAMIMAGWCFLKTLFTMEMRWRGIVYRVGWRGRVVKIVSSEQ